MIEAELGEDFGDAPGEAAARDGRGQTELRRKRENLADGSASLRFGLRPQGDVIAPCCKPGAAVAAAGTGAFERLSKAISVPPGCDLSRCSVTVELLSQGIVYVDEVRLEWSS